MEIERKFLVKTPPDLTSGTPVRYERYYLKNENGIEERIQKRGDVFEYEYKEIISPLERTKKKEVITEEKFLSLKQGASQAIIRDGYDLGGGLSIKIYRGVHEGLQRAEVEFSSMKEAEEYSPKEWMGAEITHTPLGKDADLLKLGHEDFEKILTSMKK